MTDLPNRCGPKPVNGAIQDGPDTVITPGAATRLEIARSADPELRPADDLGSHSRAIRSTRRDLRCCKVDTAHSRILTARPPITNGYLTPHQESQHRVSTRTARTRFQPR